MSERLIDANALMKVIREHDYPLRSHFNSTDNGMFTIGVQQAVDDAPTIDAVPVVRGKWMPTDMGGGETDEAYVCSVCGEPWTLIDGTPRENNMHYCPNCGANMALEDSTKEQLNL